MAKKKQLNLRIGLYTLHEGVDTWLRLETEELSLELVSKEDTDRDLTGLNAILLLDVQDPERAEDLYLFAQEAISQGVDIIWACVGPDSWFRQVNQEMLLKNQKVIDLQADNPDPVKVLQGLYEFYEEWQSRISETEGNKGENIDHPKEEESIETEREIDAESAAAACLGDDAVKNAETQQKNIEAPIKRTTNKKFEKIRRRVAIDTNRDQKLVVREKFVRVGTTTIALVGASSGSGCTYSAIQMGLFLRRYSKHVAVIELRDDRDAKPYSFMSFISDQTLDETAFHLNGIDFAYTDKPSHVLKNKHYDYVVMDIGSLRFYDQSGNLELNKHIDELERATIGCVTATGSPWGAFNLSQFLIDFHEHRMDWNILLQHPSAEQKNDLEKDLESVSGDSFHVFGMPCQPDPFVLEEETAKELLKLLRPVIPQNDEKTNFLKKIFG